MVLPVNPLWGKLWYTRPSTVILDEAIAMLRPSYL